MSDSSGTSFLEDFFGGLAEFFGGIVDGISGAFESLFNPGGSTPAPQAEAPAPQAEAPAPQAEAPAPAPQAPAPQAEAPAPQAEAPAPAPQAPAPQAEAPAPQAEAPAPAPQAPAPQAQAPAPQAPDMSVQTLSNDAAGAQTAAASPASTASTSSADPFDDALKYLDDNWSGSTTGGKCAYAVKRALEKMTLPDGETPKHDPTSVTGAEVMAVKADMLGYRKCKNEPITLSNDNALTGPAGYTPQKGDVVVFYPTTGHAYGHIQMWDGTQWRSDFKQGTRFRPSSSYVTRKHDFTIYRHSSQSASCSQAADAASDGAAKDGAGDADKAKAKAGDPSAARVTNNDKEIVTKGSGHVATTGGATDRHHPVGKGSPASYVNEAPSANLQNGTQKTEIDGQPIMILPSTLSPSNGGTSGPHPDHMPGTGSGKYMDEAKATKASPDCYAEGCPVVRTGDPTTQNKENTKGVMKKAPPPAAKAGKAEQDATAAAKPKTSGVIASGGALSPETAKAVDEAADRARKGWKRYIAYDDGVKVGGSLAWRANNPGNLRSAPTQIAKTPGAVGDFAVFATMEDGREAQKQLYLNKYGDMTVRDAIGKLTPSVENDTASYLKELESGGINLDGNVKSQIDNLMVEVEKNEGVIAGEVVPRSTSGGTKK